MASREKIHDESLEKLWVVTRSDENQAVIHTFLMILSDLLFAERRALSSDDIMWLCLSIGFVLMLLTLLVYIVAYSRDVNKQRSVCLDIYKN
jgi:hypothetical protein